ncbi:hypothetical protein KVT40_005227 [Elsinoe batatas]|uniref:MACPF domain-containing protein n=1 Tax=Elsinoe batatas TaxID=2601811 RepID=A0A8K0PF66_9PEZI|nr:hypothetical protein KVT40_005227 [Elsinoe batatas]
MSRFSRIHGFCTVSGILLADESLTLVDYFAIEPVEAQDGVPSLSIYYRTPAANPTTYAAAAQSAAAGQNGAAGGLPGNAPGVNLTLSGAAAQPASTTAPTPAPALPALTAAAPIAPAAATGKPAGADVMSAGKLTEDQWGVVLQNCGVFYGWIVDRETRQIRRAPKAAVQLRSKTDPYADPYATAAQNAAVQGLANGYADNAVVATSQSSQQGTSATTPPTQEQAQKGGLNPAPVASNSTETANTAISVPTKAEEASRDLELPSERAARLAAAAAPPPTDTVSSPFRIPIKSDKGIPNYRVNDDSKIDITVCTHQLAVSLAHNDFSSQSTEASVSGGAFGVTVGVSAGYAKSESSAVSHGSDMQTQIMVARYMYPRCDLFLTPDDLEPSPELAQLVDTVRQTKNIKALRKIQSEFGQVFCQQLTLGARLLSTRTMSSNKETSDEEKKQEFKVSVGVSVSTPYGGASVKHEEAKGSGDKSSRSETNINDNNVFEAVGGDTLFQSELYAVKAHVNFSRGSSLSTTRR